MGKKKFIHTQSMPSRISKWDNLRGFLILCVVIGHFIQNGVERLEWNLFRVVFLCIYSFHMPLFIFLMGLFYRNVSDGKPKTERIWLYMTLYIVMKVIILLTRRMTAGEGSFSLFTEGGAPWYLFAAAVYIVLAYIVRNRKPGFVLSVSFYWEYWQDMIVQSVIIWF